MQAARAPIGEQFLQDEMRTEMYEDGARSPREGGSYRAQSRAEEIIEEDYPAMGEYHLVAVG